MKKAFDEYERIGKSTLGMSSVWLGKDHLLYVRGRGFLLPFREEYKRYRYQDIRAIGIAKTGAMWGIGLVSALFLTFWILIFGSIWGTTDLSEPFDVIWDLVVLPALALVSLFFLVRNFALGPTCKTVLETEIKSEALSPLSRFSRANNAISKLEEKVKQAQSENSQADA